MHRAIAVLSSDQRSWEVNVKQQVVFQIADSRVNILNAWNHYPKVEIVNLWK